MLDEKNTVVRKKTRLPSVVVRIISRFVHGEWARCWVRINGRLMDLDLYKTLLELI